VIVSKQSISRLLRERKWTRKRGAKAYTEADASRCADFLRSIATVLSSGTLALDECAFFLNHHGACWSLNPLKTELRRHCKVVSVDEHLTSKLCQFCGQRTRNIMRRVASEGHGHWRGESRITHHQVHSVLHCGTNGCRGTTMNRDVNGASNIIQVFLSVINTGNRPERFLREREV
jgi:hypothetical protein